MARKQVAPEPGKVDIPIAPDEYLGDQEYEAVTVRLDAPGAPTVLPRPKRWVAVGRHEVINPDTGLNAVFLDGETVPDWALPDGANDASTTPAD